MILKSNGEVIASDVEFAEGIISQSKGLMFRKRIAEKYALVFILPTPKSVSVHMLFVFFPIDVLFLDADQKIVGATRLKSWTGLTRSPKNTKYIIEISADSIEHHGLIKGERIKIDRR